MQESGLQFCISSDLVRFQSNDKCSDASLFLRENSKVRILRAKSSHFCRLYVKALKNGRLLFVYLAEYELW